MQSAESKLGHLLVSMAFLVLVMGFPAWLGAAADWPTLRGDARHIGYSDVQLRAPFHLAWVRHFDNERLGTAMEPIVARDRVFVATHAGNLYALDARDGRALWRFGAAGPFLHSPAAGEDRVVAASADGYVYALTASRGAPRWRAGPFPGGFSASPLIDGGSVFIGSRGGEFLAIDLASGTVRWKQTLDVPIRQTAAAAGGQVFVCAEDLRVRAFDANSGKITWTSEPCIGQTARDYYPVIARAGAETLVIVRTNPILNFGQLIARDRAVLAKAAGTEWRNWQEIDAWTKDPKSLGTPQQIEAEQSAIVEHLKSDPLSRTFFVFEAKTGRQRDYPPVLWCGGCEGVPAPPVVRPDGKLIVEYRTARSNWNLGVAPLVGLGILDLTTNRIEPLRHNSGMQPPWNTFWGTADEAQNFNIAGNSLLIVHQSTLSAFDLQRHALFPIRGERDSWAGFRNLPWARNEWNGPAKGGAAVASGRVFWTSGSRILCVVSSEKGEAAKDEGIRAADVPGQKAEARLARGADELARELEQTVGQVISREWAPLFCDPGLSGREFAFDTGSDIFESLCRAYPHLSPGLREKVKQYLLQELQKHPPLDPARWPKPDEGNRREWFEVPKEVLGRLEAGPAPRPFANVYAIWLCGETCGEQARVNQAWPDIRASFDDFIKTGWKLDPDRGDLHANRYIASLLAFGKIADANGDAPRAEKARTAAGRAVDALAQWWRRAAAVKPAVLSDISQWDKFINSGDALFFKIAPHRHKVALFHELTPEVARLVRAKAPEAIAPVWQTFHTLCPTWWLTGEERQVHFGENFVDPPDFSMGAFRAAAWLMQKPPAELSRDTDIPWGKADLFHIEKLALALDAASGVSESTPK